MNRNSLSALAAVAMLVVGIVVAVLGFATLHGDVGFAIGLAGCGVALGGVALLL